MPRRIARTAAILILALGAQAAFVPRQSPEFVIKGTGGQMLLSQLKGKIVLLMFMFTTCPHCQHASQIISGLQKEYGPRGFQAVGCAFNENAPLLVPGFISRFQPAFPVGSAPRESVLDYLQHPGNVPFNVPIFVLLDRKGQIREQHENDAYLQDPEKSIRASIENLLKASAGRKKK